MWKKIYIYIRRAQVKHVKLLRKEEPIYIIELAWQFKVHENQSQWWDAKSHIENGRISKDTISKEADWEAIYNDVIGIYDNTWGREELLYSRDNTWTMHWNIRFFNIGLVNHVLGVNCVWFVLVLLHAPKRACQTLFSESGLLLL